MQFATSAMDYATYIIFSYTPNKRICDFFIYRSVIAHATHLRSVPLQILGQVTDTQLPKSAG